MNQNIGKESNLVSKFKDAINEGISVKGNWEVEITRADGTIERNRIENVVLAVGLDFLAARAVGTADSAMNYIAIGTVTAQPSLGSTEFGEIDRKAVAVGASSKEVIVMSNTWGGAADSLTGIALGSAVVTNHANSGEGTLLNFSNSINATLQQSDLLKLQAEIQVGSHNL